MEVVDVSVTAERRFLWSCSEDQRGGAGGGERRRDQGRNRGEKDKSRAEQRRNLTKRLLTGNFFFFQVSSEAAICWSLAAITTSRYLRRAYFQMGGREEDLWM